MRPEDIILRGELTPELIEGLKDEQRIITDICTIKKEILENTPFPNQYIFTFASSLCLADFGTPEEIVGIYNNFTKK
ncbi:hypothetical protein MHB54_27855 [Paenibacillus sp. FSL M7-0802]|uniref:hypothetical protein n=1 Tax=Paenibacillus sp. FSL M7-0802 TaxID=2921536 RepID=UPI0030F81E56